MNEPKNIGAIVRDAYEAAGIPVNYQKATPVPTAAPESACSWLGRWSDVGWAIRIEPRLTDEQWRAYGKRSNEGWDEAVRRYDPLKTLEVLASLVHRHKFTVSWPKCGKRTITASRTTGSGLPVYVVCGEVAKHTDTHLQDVHGVRTAIARCDAHQGLL
jgi:hypothetical protein